MAAPPRSRVTVDTTLDQKQLDEHANLINDGHGDRLAGYHRYRRYYDGDQNAQPSARAAEYLEMSGQRWCENIIQTVVDVFAERCEVTGFVAATEEDVDSPGLDADGNPLPPPRPITDHLLHVWEANRMDAKQDTPHHGVVKLADYFVITEWDTERGCARIVANPPDIIKPIYSDECPDELEVVVKKWATSIDGKPATRMTLYFPNRIEKYIQATGDKKSGWMRFEDVEGEAWPVPWVRTKPDGVTPLTDPSTGEEIPRGICVTHFRLGDHDSKYGRSQIHHVIPQQDALNKHILDLNDGMDYQAWRTIFVAGIKPSEVTAAIELTSGTIIATENADAKATTIPAADLKNMIGAIESDLQRIAGLSRTPLRYLMLSGGGGPVSGESIRAADNGLVAKVRSALKHLGCCWEDVMRMALILAVDHGVLDAETDTSMRIRTSWRDPEVRDEKHDWETAILQKNAGLSQHTIYTQRGLDADSEIAKADAEREAGVEMRQRTMGMGLGGGPLDDDPGDGGDVYPVAS